MSKWAPFIEEHRAKLGLGRWDTLPESEWSLIAAECGPDELAEIRQRLTDLEQTEGDVPAWDGDSQDDVARAREMLTAILKLFADRDPSK